LIEANVLPTKPNRQQMDEDDLLETYSCVYSGHNCSCISNKAYAFCRTEKESVTRMEKVGLFDCSCSHQSVVSPSLCLWTFWAHFV